MAKRPTDKDEGALLRRRAEERLAARAASGAPRSDAELLRLVHELEVHRIELELQNESLQAAHREAEQAAARLADLHDFAPIGFASVDADGAIRAANLAAARLLGAAPEALAGKRFSAFVAPSDRAAFRELVLAALVDDGRPARELALHESGGGGAPRWIRVTASSLPRSAGEALLALEDVTEQRRAAERLRDANARLTEADRHKNDFLGVLSHELRNPLAPIRNAIHILERVAADGPAAATARQVLRRQADHLTRIVDDLLDLTRISRGKIELAPTRLDLREAVLRASEDYRTLFDQGGITLRHDLPDAPVWLDADPTRLAQVIGNLLQNAAKFTPASGTVTVQASAAGGAAELRVRDTGAGMRPDELDRVFEPFVQGDQGLARSAGGLGLGLALSKALVALHGGSIEARSDGPGRGSELRVRLALATAPAAEAAPPRTATAPAGGVVLVIDDHADTCTSLAAALSLEGWRVHTAPDGRSGMAAARDLRPDAVLCDLGLPDVDGYEVARTLRSDPALSATRLIAVSGYARPEDRERARAAGFEAHVAKPPAVPELHALLARRR